MNEYERTFVAVSTLMFSTLSFAFTLFFLAQIDSKVTTTGLVATSLPLSFGFDFAFCGVARLSLICIRSIIREELERRDAK